MLTVVSFCRYFKLKKCVTGVSSVKGDVAVGLIPKWPARLTKPPSRAMVMKNGIDVFTADTRRWARRVSYYKNTLQLKLGTTAVRNVMDMNAFLGGFAAALESDPVWVMNVVPAQKLSTLSVIYDRGLIGVYHDWYSFHERLSVYELAFFKNYCHGKSISSTLFNMMYQGKKKKS